MATAITPEPAQTDCPICYEQYTDPKLLPCGHITCSPCLLSWLKSEGNARCPLCQDQIINQNLQKHVSFEDVVKALPTELSMVGLVEAERLLNKEQQCCLCEDVVATCLCLNCGDMFCKSCRKLHNKQKVANLHQVEDLSSLTPESLAASQRLSTCSTHTDKTCHLFCSSHSEAACHVCAMTRHRSCPEVKELEEKVKEAQAVLEKLVARLDAGKEAMGRSIEQLEQQLQESEKKTQAMLREIDETCDRLKSSIEQCRRRLKQLVLNAKSDVKEGVSNGKTHLLHQKGKFTCHKFVMERIQQINTPFNEFTTMCAVMEKRVNDLDSNNTLPDISMATLVIDPSMVSSLEKGLAELGEVRLTPLDVVSPGKLQPGFQFHENRGTNIELTNNQKTAARRTSGWGNGIVMSCEPMERNTLFEVQIDEVNIQYYRDFTAVGVVTESPDTVALPDCPALLPSAVAVWPNAVCINTVGTNTSVASALGNVKAGSRVGVMVDTDYFLHVMVDGQDLGRVTPDHRLSPDSPVYAMFDLVWTITEDVVEQLWLVDSAGRSIYCLYPTSAPCDGSAIDQEDSMNVSDLIPIWRHVNSILDEDRNDSRHVKMS